MKIRTTWVFLGTLVIIGGIVFLLYASRPEKELANTLPHIKISTTEYVLSAFVYAAEEQGLFEKHGVDVELVETQTGKGALRSVASGQAHLAVAADTPLMFSIARGIPLTVIASLGLTNRAHALVARRDSAIAKIADLAGKRIAFTPESNGHFFLDRLLSRNDLTGSYVERVEASPQETSGMLVSGQVDAMASWEPWIHKVQAALKEEAIILQDATVYQSVWNLVATKDFATENPKIMTAVLEALEDAEELMMEEGEPVYEATAHYTGLAVPYLRRIWPHFHFELSLDQALIVSLEEQTKWAIAAGLLPFDASIPNYLDFIDPSALRQAKPTAVRIAK